jgi:hypothetical protein
MFRHFPLVIRSWTLPVPIASQVTLAAEEQSRLESIVRAQSTPQAFAFRCQVILRAAAPDRPSHLPVAQELHWNRHTVGRWRSRSRAHGLSGLQDAPRPGRPRRFSPLPPSGGDGDSHPYTCHLLLPRHPLESERSRRRPVAAAHLDHESFERLASARCGGPHTPSQWLLAEEPRPRL